MSLRKRLEKYRKPEQRPEIPDEDKIKVLIVDDDKKWRDLLEDYFNKYPEYIVTICKTGEEALEHLPGNFHVAVLDIKMEGVSGLDIQERILKEAPWTKTIFNTGYAGDFPEEDVIRKYKAGYHTKNESTFVLMSKVDAAADHSKKHLELLHNQENLEAIVEERTRELTEARTFAAIGTLATGITHNIKNTLNGITNHSAQMIEDSRRFFREDVLREKYGMSADDSADILRFIEDKYLGSNEIKFIDGMEALQNGRAIQSEFGDKLNSRNAGDLASIDMSLQECRKWMPYLDKYGTGVLKILQHAYNLGIQKQGIGSLIGKSQKMIDDIMNMSKLTKSTDRSCDLNSVIESLMPVYKSECESLSIELHTEYDESLPQLNIDPNVFKTALQIMYDNSKYALKSVTGERKISVKTYISQDGAYLEFRDTGVGIGNENIERIFEPFFTTKPGSLGTGIGLYIVYTLSNMYGGIEVESDEGTVFRIRIDEDHLRKT